MYKTKKIEFKNLDKELKKFKPDSIVQCEFMGETVLVIYKAEPFKRDEEWIAKVKTELAESK